MLAQFELLIIKVRINLCYWPVFMILIFEVRVSTILNLFVHFHLKQIIIEVQTKQPSDIVNEVKVNSDE